jgi:hypothetical protein
MVDEKLFMHIYNNYNVELDTVDLLVTHNLPPGQGVMILLGSNNLLVT